MKHPIPPQNRLLPGHSSPEAMEFARCVPRARNVVFYPGDAEARCSDCKVAAGGQHKPSCHRQGLVTTTSDYRERKP